MANGHDSPHPAAEAQEQHGSEHVTIRSLIAEQRFYQNYPRFQRQYVWPLKFKRALIDSIFRGAPISALFAYKARNETGEEVYWILDGHQRLDTIYSFVAGEFTTWSIAQAANEEPCSLEPIEPGRYYHELSDRTKNLFLSYKFTVDVVDYVNDAQIGMYYRRIQHHLPLKLGEKLVSYESQAVKYATQLKEHPVWKIDFYKGGIRRNEPLAGSLSILASQMKQGCTAVTSTALHRFASGSKDVYMTQALYDTVSSRLDVARHVFDGIVTTHPIEVVLLYQAVMFLEREGATFTTSDKGCLADWFGELQVEGLRLGRRGYSYALGDKLRETAAQEDFWQLHLPAITHLCGHKDSNAA